MAYTEVVLNPGSGGERVAVDEVTIGGSARDVELVKLLRGGEGAGKENATAAARTQVTGVADAEILAANAARWGVVIQNDGDQDFYLGEGTTAVTSSNMTVRLRPGDVYQRDDYTGAYRGFFAAALGSGRLLITEVT